MESKKDIGKLFRENLEQLDFTPSIKVWEQIELDLEKKKKKSRFFIWFFFSTILISGLLIGVATTLSDKNSDIDKDSLQNSILNEKQNKNNPIVTTAESNRNKDASEDSTLKNNSDDSKKEAKNNENDLKKFNNNNTLGGKAQKENQDNSNQNLAKTTRISKKKGEFKTRKTFVPANSDGKSRKKSGNAISKSQKNNANETLLQSDSRTNATTQTKDEQQAAKNTMLESIEKNTPIDSLIAATNNKKVIKKETKQKDSLAVKDSVTIAEKSKDFEIVVAPYYGMNYNGYFGEFDAISNNPILENKGTMTSTYGIVVRWMFGSKLGVQVGVGKINSRYFSTIEKTGSAFINQQNVNTEKPIDEINGTFVNSNKVKFTYESSFLEVPLEGYYVLRDKKLGLATSFGVSMLFSGKNTVFAEAEGIEKMKIGALKTASPTGTTANLKLYLFYKITPSLQLDLYPSFQYQIMGSTDSSSNYSSYFFSVRTGLSYKL